MLLLLAALADELRTVLDLCPENIPLEMNRLRAWEARMGETEVRLVRTGVGPARSAAAFARALEIWKPDAAWVTGFAGALDPALASGHLLIADRAVLISSGRGRERPQGTYPLCDTADLLRIAQRAGLPASVGAILTSDRVVAEPESRQELHHRSACCAVDMETAALARIASMHSLPFSCIRAIADEAGDRIVHREKIGSQAGPTGRRQIQVLDPDGAVHPWQSRTAKARRSLRRFFEELVTQGGGERSPR